jgi:DNA repair protein RadC
MKTMNLFNSTVDEINIVYHHTVRPSERKKITNSSSAYEILRDIWNDQVELYESFYILLLNRANKVLGYRLISMGGVSGTVVDPKAIFQAALLANASNVILAHNHPSGTLTPSEADERITKKLKAAGELLEIHVLDHLIIGDDQFFSFADEGRL